MIVWRIDQRGIIKLKAKAQGRGREAVMTIIYMWDATGLNPEYGRESAEKLQYDQGVKLWDTHTRLCWLNRLFNQLSYQSQRIAFRGGEIASRWCQTD